MAFPVIATSETGAVVANSTSWTLTYPASIASGDLLLIIFAKDGSGTTGTATDFTQMRVQVDGDGAANAIGLLGKVAAGTETGTFTLTTDSEQGVWLVLRITGWYGGAIPTPGAPDQDGISYYTYAPAASSPSTTPVVQGGTGTHDPANWGTEDTLWLACSSSDNTVTYTAKDAAFTYATGMPATSGGAGGAGLAVAYKNDAVASLDPGDYTLSASENWVTAIVAIRPAAAAADRVPRLTTMPQLLAH